VPASDKNILLSVFETVARELPAAGVDFLLVGGLAVNHYGYTRSTLDVDFMIAAGDLGKVRDVMVAAGFTNCSLQDVVASAGGFPAGRRLDNGEAAGECPTDSHPWLRCPRSITEGPDCDEALCRGARRRAARG
jgi:hypothetical protein